MDIYFSTVIRYAPLEIGGEFVRLNWENDVIEQTAVANIDNYPFDDPNPRGNARGGRGIACMNDEIVACTYHTLKIYDRQLNLLREFSHHLMAGLHEVHARNTHEIWVASTAIGAALLFDLKTEQLVAEHWPREIPALQQRWNLTSLEIDKSADNRTGFLGWEHTRHDSHLHLNAITDWQGELYAFFNRFGAIVNLDRGEVLIEDQRIRGGHNLIIRDDGIAFVNDSRRQHVYVFDLNTRTLKKRINLLPFHWIGNYTRWYHATRPVRNFFNRVMNKSSKVAHPFFVRGMDVVGDDLLFVGVSPASIVCIDWRKQRLVKTFTYSRQIETAVHGLKVVVD